jgi:hypothetical protein
MFQYLQFFCPIITEVTKDCLTTVKQTRDCQLRRIKLRMPELSRRDPRTPAYSTKKELQMPKPMVDILTGDYYHPKPAKKPQGITKSDMLAAFDGCPFSSRGPVKLETDNMVPDRSRPSACARVSYPGKHRPIYPLGLSHLVATPLVD